MRVNRLLAACLILTALLSARALAEPKPVIRLWDISVDKSFWREHPEWGHKLVWYDPFGDPLQEIEKAQPDVLLLRLYNDDLRRFAGAGLTADLSSSAAIADALSRMPPWIQELVTAEDGRILALPTSAIVRPFSWYQDAWDAAGLTEDDVPQSYTELLDFLDAWAENPAKNVCASRLIRWGTGTETYDYANWLIELLLLCQEMQQRYAGEPVAFHTPAFVELAQRARETGLALYHAEPRRGKRRNMLQLFQSDIHGGEHANNGRPYGMSHTVPLRLTSDQPKLAWCSVEAAILRDGSPLPEAGMALLEYASRDGVWWHHLGLYTDFAAGDYPYEDRGFGHVDEGWLADYRDYDGVYVAYPISFHATRDGLTGKERLVKRFCKGELSAEAFAKRLDELLR